MQANMLPAFDMSVNITGCCPQFNPKGWDGQELHFRDKRFVRATTRNVMHVPLNMSKVFARVLANIDTSDAMDPNDYIVLSRNISAFSGEHLFAVSKDVPGEEMTTLSGDFLTKVFEGPYTDARHWAGELATLVKARGLAPKSIWFFYTTCPKCAKVYGKNYVVGVAQLGT
jgi:hypothetical protein